MACRFPLLRLVHPQIQQPMIPGETMQEASDQQVKLSLEEPTVLSPPRIIWDETSPLLFQEEQLGPPMAFSAPFYGAKGCYPPPSIWEALQHPLDHDVWKPPLHYDGLEPPDNGYVGFSSEPQVGIFWDDDIIDLGWIRDDRCSRHDIKMFSQPDPRGPWLPRLPAIIVTHEVYPKFRWMWRDPFLDVLPHGRDDVAPYEEDAPVMLNPHKRAYGGTGG